MTPVSYILLIQGLYWLVTGLWGLLDIDSFMLVTGPKTDIWLVKTVSVLIIVISLSLLSAVNSKEQTRPVILLAISSCIGLAGIDLYYSLNNVISKIYLLDAAAEIIFLIAWAVMFIVSRNKKPIPS
ncbi:MAG: hypothetical protein H0X70_03345 [Segetibacter sp.]|nr:hypothetical protein [Segetibacter sp.]